MLDMTAKPPRFSPWGLAASGTESGHQQAFFAWVNRATWLGYDAASALSDWENPHTTDYIAHMVRNEIVRLPELCWLHSIPNGGERGAASAGTMKAEGVKSGVADIFWPFCVFNYNGLYIEMKREDGKLADFKPKQVTFAKFVTAQGFAWAGCFGWTEARDALLAYASGSFAAWHGGSRAALLVTPIIA